MLADYGVGWFEEALAPDDIEGRFPRVAPGYAELTVLRRQEGASRDDLLLAQHFSGRPLDPGADEVWSRIETDKSRHLRLVRWDTHVELEGRLFEELVRELDLTGPDDERKFVKDLGSCWLPKGHRLLAYKQSPELRVEVSARQPISSLLLRQFGITAELGWVHEGVGLYLTEKGLKDVRDMSIGGTQTVGDFTITMTNAIHSGSIVDGGRIVYLGGPAGFVVRSAGAPTIYFAGDTALFGDMKIIGEIYKPEIAFLPIGDHYTMGPDTAAIAAEWLGVKQVVPMHWGTFPLLTGTPAKLKEQLAGKQIEVLEMKAGETAK